MRRALAVAAAAAGVAALGAVRRRPRPASVAPQGSGTFGNAMAYTRFGTGRKTLLWIPDPGHAGHHGPYQRFMAKVFAPFVEAGYSVFLVGHKPGLDPACSLADLADDYADLVAEELHGRVDLVVGDSGGGMVAFSLAARHPDRFGHLATVAAGHRLGEDMRTATVESARLLAAGRRTEAAEVTMAVAFPQVRVGWVRHLMALVAGRVSFPATVDPGDVLAGAEALAAFDGRRVLPGIEVPVLVIGGDRDSSVPVEIYRETAELIPGSTLRIYRGKDHLRTISDPRLARDVLDFVGERAAGPA